jgi:hypothetical protein
MTKPKASRQKPKRRWPKQLQWYHLTIPANVSLVGGRDRKIAKSHLVFQVEAYEPHDAFKLVNQLLSDVLENADHNGLVYYVPMRAASAPGRRR